MTEPAAGNRYHFDPIGGFQAGEPSPPSPGSVPFDRVPPFLRALLVTDGTVTRSLEAYLWEPIEVRRLHQEEVRLNRDIPSLELSAGDPVFNRQVLLRGAVSGRTYTFAESLIRTDRLWNGLRENLIGGNLGMGELLRDRRMETYRQLLSVWEEEAGGLSGLMGIDSGDRLLARSYRIFTRQSPVILITEKFPFRHFL
jgi:chorismate-pyruvate lyase